MESTLPSEIGGDMQDWNRLIQCLRPEGSPLLKSVSDDVSDRFKKAFEQLSPVYREVLKRIYLDEESEEQIGLAMSLPLLQVKLLKRGAITIAHELVEKLGLLPCPENLAANTNGESVEGLAQELQDLQAPGFLRALEVFGTEQRAYLVEKSQSGFSQRFASQGSIARERRNRSIQRSWQNRAWRSLLDDCLSAVQCKYTALDGEGARRFGGRWNSPGKSIVYTAESVSLAILETRVH